MTAPRPQTRRRALLGGIGIALATPSAGMAAPQGYTPPAGFIGDEALAINIAELVLVSIYGREVIDRQLPLTATSADDTWIVRGTLRPGRKGGVAEIRLSKADGRILSVTHGE